MSRVEPGGKPVRSWFHRISTRILLVALLCGVVPVLLIGAMLTGKVRNDLVVELAVQHRNLVGAVLNGITSLLEGYARQVRLMAIDPDVQGMDPEKQTRAIWRFLDLNPLFYSCFVYRVDGTVNALAFRNRYRGHDAEYIGRRNLLRGTGRKMRSLRIAFRQALRWNRAVFCGEVVASREQNLLMLMVPIPHFFDARRIIGMLGFAISIEGPEMRDLIKGYPLTGGDVLVLVDRRGAVLAARGSALPEGLTGLRFDRALVRRDRQRFTGLTVRGKPYLGILSVVPQLDGYLLVARPTGDVLGFLDRLLANVLVVMLVAVGVALALTWLLSRSLAGKVESLLAGIRQVREGIVSHRVEVEGDDELAEACAAFNDMVATLEKHRLMDEIWSREWQR